MRRGSIDKEENEIATKSVQEARQVPPYLERALRIFLDELETHLEFFSCVVREQIAMEGEAKIEEELTRRFHLIKGGAGFLGLKEISAICSGGESLCSQTSNLTWKERGKLLTQLQGILSDLNHWLIKLRAEAADE